MTDEICLGLILAPIIILFIGLIGAIIAHRDDEDYLG